MGSNYLLVSNHDLFFKMRQYLIGAYVVGDPNMSKLCKNLLTSISEAYWILSTYKHKFLYNKNWLKNIKIFSRTGP